MQKKPSQPDGHTKFDSKSSIKSMGNTSSQSQLKQSNEKKNYFEEVAENLARTINTIKEENKTMFLCGYFSSIMELQYTNIEGLEKMIISVRDAVRNHFINPMNFFEVLIEASITMKGYKNLQALKYMEKFESKVNELLYEVSCNKKYIKQCWANRELGQSLSPKRENCQHGIFVDEESLKLIKLLQEEDKKERDKVENKKIECQVCLQEIKYIDMGTLSCGHIFHKLCISQHIEQQINKKNIEIPCPSGCPKKLLLEDIEEYSTNQYKEKYDRFCLDVYIERNDKSISWCPTAGCTAIFSFDAAITQYRCPVCRKNYCLSCRCEQHKGMTCKEYQINNNFGENDKKFQAFIKGAKFKQCPKCKFWVERTQGCSSMTCRCGAAFCYDCGGVSCPHGSCTNSGRKK